MEVIELKEESNSSTASFHSYNDIGALEDDASQTKSNFFTSAAANSKKGQNICPHCSFPFKWPGNLREHIKFYHTKGKAAPCRHCDKAFETVDLLRQHVKEHLSESRECPSCNLNLGRLTLDSHYSHCASRSVNNHLAPLSAAVPRTPQGKYEQFSTTDDIAILYWRPQVAKAEAIPRLVDAGVKPLSPYRNNDIVPSAPVSNPNPFYVKTVNLPSNKYSSPHLLCSFINSQTPDAGEETSKCPLCATDVYQNTIIAHLIDIHEMSFENVICVYTALNKKFTRVVLCKWCKREFKKSSSCTAHSRCCYRRPTFHNNSCSQCRNTFSTYEEYLAHFCCKEYKSENAQCTACKILLNNLLTFDFKNHEKICKGDPDGVVMLPEVRPSVPMGGMMTTRGRQKEFNCPRCNAAFHLKSILDDHCLTCFQTDQLTSLDQVDDVSQLEHSCPSCGQCFLTAAMLAGHSCDVMDTDASGMMVSEPIIPLVEPPQAAYRRVTRGRPRGRSRGGGALRRRGRPPGRGRGSRRRTYSDSDTDSDYNPEDLPYKKPRLADRSYDNGHSQQQQPANNNNFFLDPSFPTNSIQEMVNSAKIQPACRNCDSMLTPHSLVCPSCGTDNTPAVVAREEQQNNVDRSEPEPEPIVIDLDKMNDEEEAELQQQQQSSRSETVVPVEMMPPNEDSGIACQYEDFSYQTINTFHGFVPLNHSHYICSKCFNNVSSLSLLAEHLATKHDMKIPDSLRIGKMKGSFVTAPTPETIT